MRSTRPAFHTRACAARIHAYLHDCISGLCPAFSFIPWLVCLLEPDPSVTPRLTQHSRGESLPATAAAAAAGAAAGTSAKELHRTQTPHR